MPSDSVSPLPQVAPLTKYIRIRVRLPDGIIAQYKELASQTSIVAARRSVRQRVLIEIAIAKILLDFKAGEPLETFSHSLRTYSLVIDASLLDEVNVLAKHRNIKCGLLISVALTTFLRLHAADRYEKLKQNMKEARVRGARLG